MRADPLDAIPSSADGPRRQPSSPRPEGEAGRPRASGRGRGRAVHELLVSARALLQDAGADSPWLTALILLEHATGFARTTLLARPEQQLAPDVTSGFLDLVDRRCAREPLAYLVSYREFYGRRFAVTPATLIPRPETEGLVDLALERLDHLAPPSPWRSPEASKESAFPLLDVGTGSGAIVVSLLAERPETTAFATDLSTEALAIARLNAQAYGVSKRLNLVACDLATAIRARFWVIVANLPYVSSSDLAALEPEVSRYEPRAALDGGRDGMSIIHGFLASLADVLAPGGAALLEFGEGQADSLVRSAHELLPTYGVEVSRDGAGVDRFLVIERPRR